MAEKLSFEEGLARRQGKPGDQPLSLDEALARREQSMRPGGRLDVRQGEELVPGSGLPGSPNYRTPMVAMSPKPAENANFGAAFKADMVEDQGTKLRLVAESVGVPVEKVGIVDGRPVFVNDSGELQFVSGPWTRATSKVVANTPEIVGSVVGSFASSPIAGSALGAMGARGLKRAAAGLLFDEPQTIGGNLVDIAAEGAFDAAGGLLGKGVNALAGRGRIADFTPADIKTAEQARDFIKQKLGIDIDLAQASGNRKLLALRDYAASYPGKTAEIVQAADEAAEGQLDVATNRVLDLVANPESSDVVGKRAINAASEVIRLARDKVYKDVDPLYKAAYAAVPEVTDENILKMLQLPRFPQALQSAKEMLELETGKKLAEDAPISLQLLDYTKRALDDQIASAKESGSRQLAGALEGRKNEFVSALDAIPNQEWKLARKRYAELSKAGIEPLEKGIVGVLASVKDEKAATAAAKIFSDTNISANEIRYARTQISNQDPEAWKSLVRQWLGEKWNVANKETQAGDVINPAGKFRQAVFGTPSDKQKIQTMLPPGAAADFDALMFAMEKLAKTPLGASRIAGSPTHTRQEISEQLRGRVSFLADMMRPREAVLTALEQRAQEQGIEAITEALMDPTKRSQLKQVVKLKPSTRQANLIGGILLGQAGQEALSDVLATDSLPAQD